MKKHKLRLEEKFILIIFIVGLLCFGLLGYFSYYVIGRMMIDQKKNSAMGMATVAAGEIDGDVFDRITSAEDEEFQLVYDSLAKYKKDGNIKYIYTMRLLDDKLVFVVDTDDDEPADVYEEYEEYLPDMKTAFAGTVSCDQEQSEDEWGSYYSAYAPIFNSQNKVVGIVGCDIDIHYINNELKNLKNIIFILVSLFAIVAVVAYMRLSSKLMERDLLTEMQNYDSLMRFGNKKYKRGKLSMYTGILMDIKDFKYLTQQAETNMGDDILRAYAVIVRKCIHRGEFIAGLGSDNFYALIKRGNEQAFLNYLKEINVSILEHGEKKQYAVHTRCGIYPIEAGDDIKNAFDKSSLALAAAKRTSTVDQMWFESSMFDAMVKEKDTLKAFKMGLKNDEFCVYYQPKVNIDTHTLCGAEALVRWFRDGKMIPPNEFIPVLENNDQIVELDFYVFEQVCKHLNEWKEQGLDIVKISSNFSKLHLKNADFSSRILALLLRYNIEPSMVEIELTESSGYQDLEALTAFVECMTQANVSTSIDDFGTGYSSLSMLRDLDVDVVKLDRSFFKNVDSGDETKQKMVEHVIHMIQDLDREVICEGIETKEQADFLKRAESPIVQGFLFDKPLPRDEFEKRLKQPLYKIT